MRLYVLAILLALCCTSAGAATWWPTQGGLVYTFRYPDGSTFEMSTSSEVDGELTIVFDTAPCSHQWSFVVVDASVYVNGGLRSCEGGNGPDLVGGNLVTPLLPAPLGPDSTSIVDLGTTTVLFEVLRTDSITVPAGTFDTYVVSLIDLPSLWFPFQGEVWLEADRGPVRIGDAELVSITGAVSGGESSFGRMKARFRN